MAKTRPINADVSAGSPPKAPGKTPEKTAPAKKPPPKPGKSESTPPKPPAPKRPRKPIPLALRLIGGTIVLAIVFIVAAIVGGGRQSEPQSETPAPVTPSANAPSSQAPAELGYPEFATNNTTRVGGPDPASNAAGVALAAFPSTNPTQQPAAVTVVDADDWQSAIAASVLMAAPVEAPVLLSEADGLPEPTSQALDALDPQGSPATGGAQVFAIAGADAPSSLKATRIGATGIAGAAAVATLRDKLFDSPPQHLVLAPADQPAFAMPAAAWAARSGDPVLFTGRDKLPEPTAAALRRHPKAPVYVLGPSSAISSAVVRQVSAINSSVRRVSGEDPVENAIALARYEDGDFGWNVNDPGHGFVIARSDSTMDAPAAAALSASGTWGPLLLTDSADTLPRALHGYLLDVKPGYTTDPTRAFYNHVWIVGNREAIDVNQQAVIDDLAELAKIGAEP
ncbi:MAG: cell wall-binding repeat-containing protein [Solirubrobacterales bacterium]